MANSTINAEDYIVINDGQFVCAYERIELSDDDSEAKLKAMDGEAYSAWCSDRAPYTPAGSVGSQQMIDFCKALEEAGADVWYTA